MPLTMPDSLKARLILRQSEGQKLQLNIASSVGFAIAGNLSEKKASCLQFWGRKWLRQFYGRLENMRSFCRKTYVHKIPRFRGGYFGLGGGECRFYFYGRGDFSQFEHRSTLFSGVCVCVCRTVSEYCSVRVSHVGLSTKFGSEQKRPGAKGPPEFVPESPLQKGVFGSHIFSNPRPALASSNLAVKTGKREITKPPQPYSEHLRTVLGQKYAP